MEKSIIIYHGSKQIIKNPTLYGGKENNDYGYGFYCTKEIELAKEWACPDNNDGYANEYLLDYAYYYHFKYDTKVYLEVNNVETIKYVTINQQGISNII